MSISRRAVLGAGLALGSGAALTACGANSDPFAGVPPALESAARTEIVVGSAASTESVVLAHLYAGALVAQGQMCSVRADLGARDAYLSALREGSVSVMPEYTSALLLHLDPNTTATTAEEVEQAIPTAVGPDLGVLRPSEAVHQDVYVVTTDFAQRNGVASLTDLVKVAAIVTLGGPASLADRGYGLSGLEQIYGAKLKGFRADDSPAATIRNLTSGSIQLATVETTDVALTDSRLAPLADPMGMIAPQNIIPLVRAEVATNPAAVRALNAVQAALTTKDLAQLNRRIDVERQDPAQVAGGWLESKGLA